MSCPPDTVCIGPYVVGEIPAPLVYTFLDADGVDIVITGYSARFIYREKDDTTPIVRNATLTDAAHGQVTYTWVNTDMLAPGHFIAEFWVGNGTQRFASVLITFDVRRPVGSVPAI